MVNSMAEQILRFKDVQRILLLHGISLYNKNEYGEYKIIYKGDRNPDHGYYTEWLDDVLNTGIDMARRKR